MSLNIDFSDLLEKLERRRELQRRKRENEEDSEEEDDGEDESGEEEEDLLDVHVKGISCDVWADSILCYFEVFEVLKYFHVSKGFYVIACLSLQNRKAKSDRVLKLVVDRYPSENFFFKLVKWNCFDEILNPHIFRNAIRKGYFEIVKYLHLKEGCHVKEWTLDIIEQMCNHLENASEEEDEEIFEGYVKLLEEFKNDIDWEELRSPEGFNIICQNKEMHEYVKSKFFTSDEDEVDYDTVLKVSCEFEYMNNIDYFIKHNLIEEKQVKEETIFGSYLKVIEKDRVRSRNRSKLLDILIPYLNISSSEFLLFFHQSIEDTGKYEDFSQLFTSKTEDFRNLSINTVRNKPIFDEYCKYLERIVEEEESEGEEEEQKTYKNKNKIFWYGVLNRISAFKFIKYIAHWIDAQHTPEKEEKITQFVDTILRTFDFLDPSFDQNVMLKNVCRNGNFKLMDYLVSAPRNLSFSSHVINKEDVLHISLFGLDKKDLHTIESFPPEIITNYVRIMRRLVKHNKKCRKRRRMQKMKKNKKKIEAIDYNEKMMIDLTLGSTNEAYRSLYFLCDYFYGDTGSNLKLMMSVLEDDEDVDSLLILEKKDYTQKVKRRTDWFW